MTDEEATSLAALRARVAALEAENQDLRAEAAVQRRRLDALDEFSTQLTRVMMRKEGATVEQVLEVVVDVARTSLGADYAAAGLGMDPARPFAPWVQRGVTPEEARALGRAPRPIGVLGEVTRGGMTVRLEDLSHHPGFQGFPAGHPTLLGFLGVVIPDTARPLGFIYVANRDATRPFTADDQRTLEALATRAGLAIQLATLDDELHLAMATRETLLAVVSHDLRNPLSNVVLALASLRRMLATSPALVQRHLEIVARGTATMKRLTDDLVLGSRIAAGLLEIRAASCDLDEIVAEAVDAVGALAATRAVTLTTSVPAGCPPVMADRGRVLQVLVNLLSNAIAYGREGGAVHVAVTVRPRVMAVAVSDDGPGIAEALCERIFERFWRGERGQGLGLGLYIVRAIVLAHGGEISLASSSTTGSTFTFTLPRAEPGAG